MRVLHIDSSIQGKQSISRTLSAAVVTKLRRLNPKLMLTYRDVVANPLPQLTGPLAAALGVNAEQIPLEIRPDAPAQRVALDEVLAANILVIGTPMYNFGIPSQLKFWMDTLAVAGTTFRYSSSGFEGLLTEKRAIIASCQGGIYRAGTSAAGMEHQDSHLRSFLNFIGITNLQIIRADGIKVAAGSEDHGLSFALKQLEQLTLD